MTLTFMKRNLKEMTRDPLIYIFCAGFPIFMVLMFQIILKYAGDNVAIFEVKSLIPGIMMFSYSMLMLITSLLISKDKTISSKLSLTFLEKEFPPPLCVKSQSLSLTRSFSLSNASLKDIAPVTSALLL